MNAREALEELRRWAGSFLSSGNVIVAIERKIDAMLAALPKEEPPKWLPDPKLIAVMQHEYEMAVDRHDFELAVDLRCVIRALEARR